MATSKRKLGDLGEELAAKHLQANGYTIYTTNWYCRRGELDIVAQLGEVWVFAEVKTRRSAHINDAFVGITPAKREKLVAAVYAFLDEHDLDDVIWRIDAIGVALWQGKKPLIAHVEDALDW